MAGVDCIDVAADAAVISSAREALSVADGLRDAAQARGYDAQGAPWLMVSLNDGEDPHFRKAEFDAGQCPVDCPRPCETICPAQAIAFEHDSRNDIDEHRSGVIDSRCYGCGRCLLVCPFERITTRSYVSSPTAIASTVLQGIDAVEIHTQVGRLTDFERLWGAIAPHVSQLQLVAVSCPDGDGLIDYLKSIYQLISPIACPVIWQTDGRPMSGDIGDGATHAAVRLGQKVLAANLPGYVQLAGGTNRYTVKKLRALGLLNSKALHHKPTIAQNSSHHPPIARSPHRENDFTSPHYISGVAYGSYARALLSPVLEQLEPSHFDPSFNRFNDINDLIGDFSSSHPLGQFNPHLECHPPLLWQAVELAHSLVSQLKSPKHQEQVMST
ncbi:MAG: LdpA C-terminal domain-containing domain [Oculatellaceae cyanobacterium bins.114]|nr:LdpA C-terminal domain-containing domain [Oculatellaceae cyanobacterium bins.114]